MTQENIKDVLKEKQTLYGENALLLIAKFWGNYLNIHITSSDVCQMMMLMKSARLRNAVKIGNPDGIKDTIVDIRGYSELLEEVLCSQTSVQ